MSLAEVAAAIRNGVAKIEAGKASLLTAATLFDAARALLQQATQGTRRPEPGQAIAAQTAALHRIAEVLTQAAHAEQGFTAYLSNVAAGDTSTVANLPAPTSAATRSPTPGIDRVEHLRRELPPPLEGANSGRKTHGRWFVGDRPAQQIISGEDEVADLAQSYLDRIGFRFAAISAHVEIKVAARVRQRWEQTGQTITVTLVINHELCGGPRSCFVYLPRLLPPGCSVTVVTPKSRHTFTGEPT
ncbi:hypothetical protein GCM10010171_63420 [Actinokineospora fastidiosa]|uniref:SCP1.201-like deaminase n=1 Tax=Actinokineospora fastidiosa TaxID=1816 RepID=A0A918LJB8_9PSEU|nr:hypothetical protein GCM10010171_63420 [Actinokineospora fastidiosa]